MYLPAIPGSPGPRHRIESPDQPIDRSRILAPVDPRILTGEARRVGSGLIILLYRFDRSRLDQGQGLDQESRPEFAEPGPEVTRPFIWCDWLGGPGKEDRKSTRLNSSHVAISYAVFCLKKK